MIDMQKPSYRKAAMKLRRECKNHARNQHFRGGLGGIGYAAEQAQYTEAERRVLNGNGQQGCSYCEEACGDLGLDPKEWLHSEQLYR
jgi:hypothetical protein